MKIEEGKYYNVVKSSSDEKLIKGDSFYLDDDELIVIKANGEYCGFVKEEYDDFKMDFVAEEDETMEYVPLNSGGDSEYVWRKKGSIKSQVVENGEDEINNNDNTGDIWS